MSVYDRLQALSIELPPVAVPAAAYVPFVQSGQLVFLSGHIAKKNGARQFSMVSALGANSESNGIYNRTKGEVEAAVIAENFPSLRIFRPSLLKGKRDEFRLAEEIGNWVSFLMTPLFALGLRRYEPVEISKLARALYVSADDGKANGTHHIYESDEIQSY